MATRRPASDPRAPDPSAAQARPSPNPEKTPRRQRGRENEPSPASSESGTPVRVSEEARRSMIAEAAYLRAERRGFMPGYETEDWLAAEAEVDALLRAGQGSAPQ